MRGATGLGRGVIGKWKNFYSRASCEARRGELYYNSDMIEISTHAPHARRDLSNSVIPSLSPRFLLTRLMRGATNSYDLTPHCAPNFYSRASCEARLTQM